MDNGMNDFHNFLNVNPIYKKFEHNLVAIQIFERLSEAHSVQKMIWAINSGKPALSGCISVIESKYEEQTTFDLTDRFTKTCLGAMVKVILEPFGYTKIDVKRLPTGSSTYIQSASTYALTQPPKVKLKEIITIEKL